MGKRTKQTETEPETEPETCYSVTLTVCVNLTGRAGEHTLNEIHENAVRRIECGDYFDIDKIEVVA